MLFLNYKSLRRCDENASLVLVSGMQIGGSGVRQTHWFSQECQIIFERIHFWEKYYFRFKS